MSLSSIGSGAPNTRSINVCVNLLSEWATDQTQMRSEAGKYLLGIVLGLALTTVVVPGFERGYRAAHLREIKMNARLAALKVSLDSASAEKTVVAPQVERAGLLAQTRGYFDRLLGELYAVLDSSKSGMAFSSAKIEVRAAEIVVNCRAEAESYEVAAAFADQAGRTPNKISTLSSTRPSALLGPAGISFEYLKKVALP